MTLNTFLKITYMNLFCNSVFIIKIMYLLHTWHLSILNFNFYMNAMQKHDDVFYYFMFKH